MKTREYNGKEFKLGWINMFMPTCKGIIEGETIYIAHDDGLYYGIGDMDGAIWIQHLPWEPDENAELFVKGVELIDKYAPTGKAKKVYAMVKSLAKRHNKASMEYCGMLNFFFALGRWNGEKKPQDHIKDCMWAYKDYVNA